MAPASCAHSNKQTLPAPPGLVGPFFCEPLKPGLQMPANRAAQNSMKSGRMQELESDCRPQKGVETLPMLLGRYPPIKPGYSDKPPPTIAPPPGLELECDAEEVFTECHTSRTQSRDSSTDAKVERAGRPLPPWLAPQTGTTSPISSRRSMLRARGFEALVMLQGTASAKSRLQGLRSQGANVLEGMSKGHEVAREAVQPEKSLVRTSPQSQRHVSAYPCGTTPTMLATPPQSSRSYKPPSVEKERGGLSRGERQDRVDSQLAKKDASEVMNSRSAFPDPSDVGVPMKINMSDFESTVLSF